MQIVVGDIMQVWIRDHHTHYSLYKRERKDERDDRSSQQSNIGGGKMSPQVYSSYLQRFQQAEVRVSRKVTGLFLVASKCRQIIAGIF